MTHGEIAYEAYRDTAAGTITGAECCATPFSDLPEAVRIAWNAAAAAVIRAADVDRGNPRQSDLFPSGPRELNPYE